jgi:hypothetical protein
MSIERRFSLGVSPGVSKTISITGGQEVVIDESVPGPSTNLAIALALDVSQLKGAYIVCDTNINLFFNEASTGSPSKTINLLANQPFSWTNLSYHTNPWGATDVTGLFVTKSGSGAARLRAWFVTDPTV